MDTVERGDIVPYKVVNLPCCIERRTLPCGVVVAESFKVVASVLFVVEAFHHTILCRRSPSERGAYGIGNPFSTQSHPRRTTARARLCRFTVDLLGDPFCFST